MKYTSGYRRAKFKFTAGFYAVVACCLLIVGGASWFALSKISNTPENSQKTESRPEYKDNTSSYIENVPSVPQIPPVTEETDKNVSKEPYSSSINNNVIDPVFTMPVEGRVIKDYSSERLQYSATFGDMRIHCGVDIECERGTQISSCGDGTVLSVVKDSSYGNTVEINHGNNIVVKYSSIDDVTVKEGDTVKLGDFIGKSTTVPSECNDKNHIHIEASKDGKSVSPLKAMGLS